MIAFFLPLLQFIDGSGSKSRVFFVALVGRAGPGQQPLGLQNFPQKSQIFQFLQTFRSKNTWVKDGSAPYLLQVRCMLGSGPISTSVLQYNIIALKELGVHYEFVNKSNQ